MEIPERRKGRIKVKRICSASYSKDQIAGKSMYMRPLAK